MAAREGWTAVDADNRRRELEQLRDIHKRPEGQLAEPSSFSERLAREREALARNPDARKTRDERDLERMRRSREIDKDRGR